MRLHRFYIPEPIGAKKEVVIQSDELANQIVKVFRLRHGDKVILFDGSGSDFEAAICDLGKVKEATVALEIEKVVPSRFMPARAVTLCAAVVKKDKFEWIAEKATELGVTKIIPIMAERSEKKGLNDERLAKIIKEATEQCGRGALPALHQMIRLRDSLEYVTQKGIKAVAFHTEGEPFEAGQTLKSGGEIEIFVGPEGGWSPAELEMFHSHGVPIVCVGRQILRAETAAVAALSLAMFS